LSAPLCSAADATDVQLLVRAETGELELFNSTAGDIAIAGYSLESSTGGFIFNQWMPITDRLDADGDGSFDPTAEWLVLSPTGSTTDLSEGAVSGTGGVLAAGEWVSIGFALDVTMPHALDASVVIDNGMIAIASPITIITTPTGDYDFDGDVDASDYAVFRETFGSLTDLRADGNGDGVVSSIDYAIWREAFTAAAASASIWPLSSSAQMAIPEPATLSLLGAALLALTASRNKRRPRRTC